MRKFETWLWRVGIIVFVLCNYLCDLTSHLQRMLSTVVELVHQKVSWTCYHNSGRVSVFTSGRARQTGIKPEQTDFRSWWMTDKNDKRNSQSFDSQECCSRTSRSGYIRFRTWTDTLHQKCTTFHSLMVRWIKWLLRIKVMDVHTMCTLFANDTKRQTIVLIGWSDSVENNVWYGLSVTNATTVITDGRKDEREWDDDASANALNEHHLIKSAKSS